MGNAGLGANIRIANPIEELAEVGGSANAVRITGLEVKRLRVKHSASLNLGYQMQNIRVRLICLLEII